MFLARSDLPGIELKSGIFITRVNLSMEQIVNEVLDMFFENEKIKKYTYPVLYVVVSFNLLILVILLIILFMLFRIRYSP